MMPSYMITILQVLSILLIMMLVLFIVIPLAIWIDYTEEKAKEKQNNKEKETPL